MRKHLQYLRYVIRHRWFVLYACCHAGIIWRGLVHDLSKFLPSEWFPYVEHFYGKQAGTTGDFHAPGGDADFDRAWLKHVHRNPHHRQHWVLQSDGGNELALFMPAVYIKEMVADWWGAGKAQGHGNDPLPWYTKNRDKMLLHPATRELIENGIGYRQPTG